MHSYIEYQLYTVYTGETWKVWIFCW